MARFKIFLSEHRCNLVQYCILYGEWKCGSHTQIQLILSHTFKLILNVFILIVVKSEPFLWYRRFKLVLYEEYTAIHAFGWVWSCKILSAGADCTVSSRSFILIKTMAVDVFGWSGLLCSAWLGVWWVISGEEGFYIWCVVCVMWCVIIRQ